MLNLLKAIAEGIRFYKREREASIKIAERYLPGAAREEIADALDHYNRDLASAVCCATSSRAILNPSGRGKAARPPSRLLQSCGTTYATIVRSIKWAGDPYPGATIEQHVVTVPDFGKIFFGEILITDQSRRLTMLRLELGSPIGGFLACAEAEDNGSWSN